MKKLVLILALFFAIGMQANTIKEKRNLKLDVKKVEMPEIGGQYHCVSRSYTYVVHYDDGSYDEITITKTHCEPIQ